MAEALRLGKIWKILMPVFDFVRPAWSVHGHRLRSRLSSETGTPSARGLSNFRRLFLRVRRCQVLIGQNCRARR